MKVAIIGGGAGGISMAVALVRAGHEPIVIERSPALGGTWHDNIYPGAACDVPSHLYSLSFAPNDWERRFARQPEIQRYFQRVADEHGLAPYLRLGTEVHAARFEGNAWHVETSRGAIVADALVSGTGQLNRPRVPALPGIADFGGTAFHSARWDTAHDLAGRAVAVVGSGASAVQIVPEIAQRARQVTVLQRSPPYVIPRNDRAYPGWERWILRNVPLVRRAYRAWNFWFNEVRFPAVRTGSVIARLVRWVALRHMRAAVADPALRAALTPDYPVGCKRILLSDDWYPALVRPNVRVVTSAIERVTADAIVTADGALQAAVAVIYATGFDTTHFLAPIEITGRDGRTLAETWRGGAEAHHGITVAGFPNLFMLYGPGTNLGHNSVLFMIECQVRYIARCLAELGRRGARWLDPRPEAMARYNAELQHDLARTSWNTGCTSWYTTDGKITNNWSSRSIRYWWQNRRPDLAEYHIDGASEQ